jgi:uncharacterized repeat protein (TIGR03803 family)
MQLMKTVLCSVTLSLATCLSPSHAVLPTNLFELTKLHDFSNLPGGAMRPYSVPIQIGDELWFTTANGGDNGFGAIGRWNIGASSFSTVFSAMDNVNGNTPQGRLARDGNLVYLTSTRGGTGDRGVLARFDVSDPVSTYTVLWNSPSNSPNTNPNTLIGNPEIVDRGTHKEIYFLTRNGGTASAHGTVQKYRTDTNTVSLVANLPGLPDGRQPLDGGFTRVGNSLYFTTFTGGDTATNPNANNGVGTLMRLDLATDTAVTLASMPTLVPNTRFPANNPAYDPVTNALYFTTGGTSTQPGALMKFDLTLESLVTLTTLTDAPTSSGPFPEGRFAYSEVVIHEGFAYFTTIQGGDFGGGTLNRFNLTSNTMAEIWHLGNDVNLGINWGLESRGGPMLANYGGQDYLFLLTRTGGLSNQGTILVMAIPEPSSAFLLLGAGACLLIRRRFFGRA